jgi:hypothetical protein
MSAIAKLMQARTEFHKRELKKTGWNDFAKFNYLDLADFLIPAIEIFASLKIAALTSFTKELATMTITDLEDGTSIQITSPFGSAALKACHEVQNIGAVETYQRRYLWVAALEIVEHDAIDSSAGKEKPKNTPTQQMKDEFDALDTDQQKVFMSVVDTVRVQLDQGNIAAGYDLYAEFRDTLEDVAHQAALRSLFSSAERTALQKENQSRKAAK